MRSRLANDGGVELTVAEVGDTFITIAFDYKRSDIEVLIDGRSWRHTAWNGNRLAIRNLPSDTPIKLSLVLSPNNTNKDELITTLQLRLKDKQKKDQLEFNNLSNQLTIQTNQLNKSVNLNLKLSNKLSSLKGLLNKSVKESTSIDSHLHDLNVKHAEIFQKHSTTQKQWTDSKEQLSSLSSQVKAKQSSLQSLSLKASKLSQRKQKLSSQSIPNIQSQLDNNSAFNRLYSSSSSLNSPSTFSPWSDHSTRTDSFLPFPTSTTTHSPQSSYSSFQRTRTTSHPSFFYNNL